MKPGSSKKSWKFTVVGIAAFTVISACSSRKELGKDDVRIALGDLRTFAAASKFLTEQNETGSLTSIFFTRQSDFLFKKVQDSLKQLDAPTNEHERERERAKRIALELSQHLDQMRNGVRAAENTRVFDQLASDAKALEDGLKDS